MCNTIKILLYKMARFHQGESVKTGAGYGYNLQSGRGVGDFLGKMYHQAAPHIKTIGKKVAASPVAQDVFKTAKKAALEAGLQIASNALRGRSGVASTLGEKVGKAKKDIADTIQKSLSSDDQVPAPRRGRKRKSGGVTVVAKKSSGKRRRRVRDIFD